MQCGVGAICTGADSSGVHNSLHTRLALLLSSATAGDFTDAGTESASFKTLFWGMLAMKASQQWPCRTPSTLTAYRTPLDVIQVFLISLRYKLCQPWDQAPLYRTTTPLLTELRSSQTSSQRRGSPGWSGTLAGLCVCVCVCVCVCCLLYTSPSPRDFG